MACLRKSVVGGTGAKGREVGRVPGNARAKSSAAVGEPASGVVPTHKVA